MPASLVEIGDDVFNFCANLQRIFCVENCGFEKILREGNRATLVPTVTPVTQKNFTWQIDGDTLKIFGAKKFAGHENFRGRFFL